MEKLQTLYVAKNYKAKESHGCYTDLLPVYHTEILMVNGVKVKISIHIASHIAYKGNSAKAFQWTEHGWQELADVNEMGNLHGNCESMTEAEVEMEVSKMISALKDFISKTLA